MFIPEYKSFLFKFISSFKLKPSGGDGKSEDPPPETRKINKSFFSSLSTFSIKYCEASSPFLFGTGCPAKKILKLFKFSDTFLIFVDIIIPSY